MHHAAALTYWRPLWPWLSALFGAKHQDAAGIAASRKVKAGHRLVDATAYIHYIIYLGLLHTHSKALSDSTVGSEG